VYHPSTESSGTVVQLTLFDAVPPGKAGGTEGVPPLEKASVVQQATAQGHTPFALARSGGTPRPSATASKPKRRPACIGCRSFQSLYRNDYLYGEGICKARDNLIVASNDSRACALYRFYGSARPP
jgi:hypothetical protein